MKLVTILLTLCVSAVLTEDLVPRAQLKNLGISQKVLLPNLGISRSFLPSNTKNTLVQVTKTSPVPTAFGFSSYARENIGDNLGLGFSSRASSGSGYGYNNDPVDTHVPPYPIIPVDLSFTPHSEENFENRNTKVPSFQINFAVNSTNNTQPPQNFNYSTKISAKPGVNDYISFDAAPAPLPYQIPNIRTQQVLVEQPQPQFPILSGESLEQIIEQDWNDFKVRFNKVYASEQETRYRREIFIENRAKIMRFNEEYAEGKRSFVHKINEFADMLLHEFSNNFNGFNRSSRSSSVSLTPATTFLPSANVVFPDSVDWRMVGAVGPVKSQGKCAACWAFAAAGALEGHHYRKTGELVEVSVQNLIDCTEPYGNNGCSGGLMDPAFEYVRNNNGVDSESSYPFEERTGKCRFRRENVVATCTGFVDIGENDEKGLEIALATLGPVTAAIDAGQETFQFYSEGIYDDPNCGNKPEQMNHAVLIVGYGQEADGRKYWLVKNSYGPNWGIGGYIKIAKEINNQCGIAIQASYPLV